MGRYIWESKADGNFAVSEDTENEPLGRGTEIRLHLKEEAVEYLEEAKLKVRRQTSEICTSCPLDLIHSASGRVLSGAKVRVTELFPTLACRN